MCYEGDDIKDIHFMISYGGKHKDRPSDEVCASDFIAVKSFKARGKRLTTFDVANVKEVVKEI